MKKYDVVVLGELLIDFTENGSPGAYGVKPGQLFQLLRHLLKYKPF